MLQTISSFKKLVDLAIGIRGYRRAPDELAKRKSIVFLNQFFSENRGLIHKIGQFQGLHNLNVPELAGLSEPKSERHNLNDVIDRLAEIYDCDPTTIFSEISETAKSASLSSVFLVKLVGVEGIWALKILTENIRKEVDSSIRSLGLLPEVGPSKKWGIPLDKYKSELAETLNREMNFRFERQCLLELAKINANSDWLVIPKVQADLCNEECMVMSYEEGLPLSQAKNWEPEIRIQIAEKLTDLFLIQLLKWPYFQTDWNAGNFLYRRTLHHIDIIALDFGSYFPFNSAQRAGVTNLFRRLKEQNLDSAIHDLVLAGFDPNKLVPIADKIPEILSAMFKPFLVDSNSSLQNWNYSAEIDQQLGELKWWFRSSGSPQLFHFVRAYSLFIQTLRSLDVPICLRSRLMNLDIGHLDRNNQFTLPTIQSGPKWKSNWLRVKVQDQRTNEEIVSISMPIHGINQIEEMLPEDVLAQLKNENIDLDKIVKDFIESNGSPQTLFSAKKAHKSYLVWTEF